MSGWAQLLAALVLVVSTSARAQDAGVPDAGATYAAGDAAVAPPTLDAGMADAQPPEPMLAVGPTGAASEVFATTTEPAHPVATARRASIVTAGEVVAEINRRAPALRAAYVDPARVDELARALVRDRVLAEAARRAGLMRDAEVQLEIERTLARVLLERALAANPGPAPDAAVARAFYDAHVADYTKPEQVRTLAIVLTSREDAITAIAEVRRASDRRFAAVVRARSTDAQSRRRGGSIGWLFVGSRPEAALIEAALALRVGETMSAPLEIDGRFYVLRVVERRLPEPVPFERARSAVVSRMRAEQRQRVTDVLLAGATREQGVRVRSAAEAVQVGPRDDTRRAR